MQLAKRKPDQSPFIGIRAISGQNVDGTPGAAFAVVSTAHYLAALESIADLGGPAQIIAENGSLKVTGPRSRYRLKNFYHVNNAPGNQVEPEVRSVINKWAEKKREQHKRKTNPAYAALVKTTRKEQKRVFDRAAFWAINRGFRGVNDALRKLEQEASYGQQSYRQALDKYRDLRVSRPENEPETCERLFRDSRGGYVWLDAPETAVGPFDDRWERRDNPPAEWRSAKHRAHRAGRELAGINAGFDNWKRNGSSRDASGARTFTTISKRLAAVLGSDIPAYSKLSANEKRMTEKDILVSYIRKATAGRALFEPLQECDGQTVADILRRRKDWIAADSLLGELRAVLETGHVPELDGTADGEPVELAA